MYNAIVVDDEEMIRNGIIKVIHWDKLGVGQVFQASSGDSAVSVIKNNKIDIMITDICMSGMDGLSLVDKINKSNKNIKIIVLTGYDTFEYAKKCCKMNIYDYLMKPVDEDELEQVIKNIVTDLNHENELIENEKIISRTKGIKEQVHVEYLMNEVLNHKGDKEEVKNLLYQYKYSDDKPIQAAVLRPILDDNKNWKQYYELMNVYIKNSCVEMFDYKHEGITFEDSNNIIIAVFADNHFMETSDRIEVLINYLNTEYNIKQKIILGSIVHNIYELEISYNDALNCMYSGDNKNLLVQNKGVKDNIENYEVYFLRVKKYLLDNINDYDKVSQSLNEFNLSAENYNLSISLLKKSCFELASSIYYENFCETNDLSCENINFLLMSLQDCKREEVFKLTKNFIIKILFEGGKENNDIVEKAKKYILENLSADINVNDIANSMFLNTNYFSRLFKKITGEGCNSYIIRKRMEKAKYLLENTNTKIGNIALNVGYKDTNYFSLAFKKQTGMSPKEFRDNRYK